MKKIISVVGTRPNFMKIAPFINVVNTYNKSNENRINHLLIHTGQHYENRMNNSFFNNLKIPEPDINLEIGSGSHAEQVGNTMIAFEKVLLRETPDWVVVVGDVNATLACSVTAKKMNIKVCHIEAGLRSNDLTMPEEINRLVTDRLSDLLLTPDRISTQNLLAEGVSSDKIAFVGNIMVDTLEANRNKASMLNLSNILIENLHNDSEKKNLVLENINSSTFGIVTMHRPSNVDYKEILEPIVSFLSKEASNEILLVWPVHPRTEKMLKDFQLWEKLIKSPKLILLYPIGYHEMLRLNMTAQVMITDSGGLQEECCVLGTPCITLRWNTERPITLKENNGTSALVGNQVGKIRQEYQISIKQDRQPQRPELWDGKTSFRCMKEILSFNNC